MVRYRQRRPPGRESIKILFLVTEDWYFVSHRLSLARACRDMGWEVVVATHVQDHGTAIESEGFRVVPIRMRRRNRAPWKEIPTIADLISLLARERPDILHQVGLKPVIYGSFAASFAPPKAVVNALAGMGYIFTSGRPLIRLARAVIKLALRLGLRRRRHWLIVQNDDDATALVSGGLIARDRLAIIAGSGVDLERFAPMPEPEGPIVAAMVSRMLKDKGVREVVLAARELKRRGTPLRVRLVGAPDPGNPTSLDDDTLRQWHREGCIEWLGQNDDIEAVWRQAHIAILPSYREGMPMALIEAASCGRPIVTTDVPGCSDIVGDGSIGFVVPKQDWIGIADALESLAASPALRARMGKAARARVEAEYGEQAIIRQTIEFYRRALDRTGRRQAVPAVRTTAP